MLLGAREEERLSFRERQPVMAAPRSMIQYRGRFAIPFRQCVGDPANIVKVAINVQRALRSKNIADNDRFVAIHCRSRHCADTEPDNLTYLHFDSLSVSQRIYQRKHEGNM